MGTITSGVGLISGINTASLIDALVAIDQEPITQLQNQNTVLETEQTAFSSISAQLLALKADADTLTNSSTFQTTTATSSDPNVSVTTTSSAQPGSYSLDVAQVVSSQQTITQGFANATSTTPGAGTLSFDFGPSQLSSDTNLSDLNGGAGVSRGEIRITDHSGASAIVNLSTAVSINDVVNAINNTSSINVTASVQGDQLVLTDNTGLSTGSLTVSNVGTTNTATSLGLTGTTTSSILTGSDINVVGSSTALDSLNDGNGVRIEQGLQDFNITTANNTSFSLSLSGANTLGDVVKDINNATGNDGAVTASLTSTGLQLTDNTTGGGSLTVSALNGSEAATDLGILGSAAPDSSQITGTRLIASLNSKLLKNLDGGSISLTPGTININGTSVDLSGAQSVSDVLNAINTSGAGVTASLNNAGDGIELATNNGGALTVSDGTGNFASALNLAGTSANGQINSGDLHLKYISEATPLQNLNGGTGVAAGSFTITDSSGASAIVNVTSATTVGDVINNINSRGLAVHAEINSDGNGILLQDTGPGATALSVTEDGSTTAQDLGILGTASAPGQNLNGSFDKTVSIASTDTLTDIANKINSAGIGVSASIINDGSSSDPYRLSLQSTNAGLQGAFVFDDGGLNLGATNLVDAQDAVAFYGSSDPSKAIAITSSSNTLSNVIPGATITLSGPTNGPATISISQNNSSIDTAVQQFVTDFNSVINTLNQYDTYNTTTQQAGLLLGDPTVENIRSSLYQYINSSDPNLTGSITSLTQLGITVGANGQLSFNQSQLDSAIQSNRAGVVQLFTYKQTTTNPVTDAVTTTAAGIGVQIDNMLSSLTDPTSGTIQDEINTLTSQQSINNNQINQLTLLVNAQRAQLQDQFNNMEQTLATLQSQGSAIASLGSLTGSSTSSGSSSSGASTSSSGASQTSSSTGV